jgi:GNAT superfamily N-acetyltransferase
MELKQNSENFEKYKTLWNQLILDIENKLRKKVQIIFPDNWNENFYQWFQEIENNAFREELRYSFFEVNERLRNSNIIFLFILVDQEPEALFLGYLPRGGENQTYYFDTLAVKHQGQGIGRFIFKSVIEWVKMENFKIIMLDTEEINEKKILLQKFYESFGFRVVNKDQNEDLTMALKL